MQSLVAKLESQGLDTSRDISSLNGHIVSKLSRIDISLDAISRSLQVQQTLIGDIARRVEIIENSVRSQPVPPVVPNPETKLPCDLNSQWTMDDEDWINSWSHFLEPTISPDITCYETTSFYKGPSNGLRSTASGSGENQGKEKVAKLTKIFQGPT